MFAEVVGCNGHSPRRQLDHLILMPGIERNLGAGEIIGLAANCPACLIFFDFPTQRLRDDLMAETDADQRNIQRHRLADEVLQRGNPVVIFIDAMLGSGDQPAVAVLHRGWKFAIHHLVACEVKILPGQQGLEHLDVVAVVGDELLGGVSGEQNADFHGSPNLIKFKLAPTQRSRKPVIHVQGSFASAAPVAALRACAALGAWS